MFLTDDEITLRLTEIQKIRVALDEDPILAGVSSLSQKLAQIQLNKDRVVYLINEAIRNQTESEVTKEMLNGEYDRNMDLLLATDPDVQNQKSESMRKAQANTKMSELVLKKHYAEIEHIKAQSYFKGLQSLLSNLESANMNLSRQITILQLSASLGEVPRGAFDSLWTGRKLTLKNEDK
jgi:hypothetical protein